MNHTFGLGRRRLMAGLAAVGAGALAGPARASIVNLCAVGSDGWLFSVWDEVRHSEPEHARNVTQLIETAVGKLAAGGVQVAISVTPAKARVYREFLPADFRFSSESDLRYAAGLNDLRRAGTIVPDQAAMLARARKATPGLPLFFKADTHWTAAGAAAAAVEMAQMIKLKAHLPTSSKPGTTLAASAEVVQRHNDLAAMLPSDQHANYPYESYAVRQPVSTGALLDDDIADVVVVGNSYMQPAYGYASVLSNELNRPVSLVWRVHQFSPFWLLLSYVQSAAFKAQRPKLIVWNFAETDIQTLPNDAGSWVTTAMPAGAFLTGLSQALQA